MPTETDALLDLLLDLKHDLGKHLGLPITMLPADASDAQLRAAADRALNQTRSGGPKGTVCAHAIWEAFEQQARPLPRGAGVCDALAPIVARALSWQQRLTRPEPLDREALQTDLCALRDRIARAIVEVHHDS